MCLCGAAVKADGIYIRVPDRCKASKFTALAVRETEIRAGHFEKGHFFAQNRAGDENRARRG